MIDSILASLILLLIALWSFIAGVHFISSLKNAIIELNKIGCDIND